MTAKQAANRKRLPRKGAELHAAGLIWEGSEAGFLQIINNVKTEIESMTEEEKEKLGCPLDSTSPDVSDAVSNGS